MAHNIEYNEQKGKHSFVSANNITAWHGLGQVLPDKLLTAEQCIREANLDFDVLLHEMRSNSGIDIPNYKAVIRSDNNAVLGVVGSKYVAVQNLQAFEFFDSIVGENKAIYETAGVLGKGEVLFLTASMPDYIRVAGTDDITKVFVVLKSSHDGSGAIKAMITPVRVVCQNTLNAAMDSAKKAVSIRHTITAEIRLKSAASLLGITKNYVNDLNQAFNKMSKVNISDQAYKELIETLFVTGGKQEKDSSRILNIRSACLESYFNGVGQENIIGTAWGAYNGISHYLDHIKVYQNDKSRFESILDGNSSAILQNAFDLLLS